MALLIPIPRSNVEALQRALNQFAPFNWQSQGKIHVFALDELHQKNIGDVLTEYCQNNNIRVVLVPKRVHCDEIALSDAGYTVVLGPTIGELVRGDGLLRRLREMNLDWRSAVTQQLKNYALGSVTDSDVDQWLSQFERLGNHMAVGRHLLQMLQVLPLADLGEALTTDSDFYGSELVIGFNNDRWGKSWGTISNLVRKKCSSAAVLPIGEAIEQGSHPKVLRIVEDGLFSGTEMKAIFDSLRGRRPTGRSQKVSPTC